MPTLQALRRHPSSTIVLAVLIWFALGNVCALAELSSAEAAPGSPRSGSSEHADGGHGASCEVTVAATPLKALVSPTSVQRVVAGDDQPGPGFAPLHGVTPPHLPDGVLLLRPGRPLFLLFASLII